MNARRSERGDTDREDPLRSLLETLARQAELLSRYLERLAEEAYVETAGDPAYLIRTEPDGTVVLRFGDGKRGRHPSAGSEPIVVEYRFGGGAAGNLGASAPGSIDAALDPTPDGARDGLDAAMRRLLTTARTATLATRRRDGRVRLVPICYVASTEGRAPVVHTPLDEKPKRTADPRRLGRVSDIDEDPDVTLLVERWDEDWRGLAWARLEGRAMLVEPAQADEHATAIARLRAKYPQYLDQRLEDRPLIRIDVVRVATWSAAAGGGARQARRRRTTRVR